MEDLPFQLTPTRGIGPPRRMRWPFRVPRCPQAGVMSFHSGRDSSYRWNCGRESVPSSKWRHCQARVASTLIWSCLVLRRISTRSIARRRSAISIASLFDSSRASPERTSAPLVKRPRDSRPVTFMTRSTHSHRTWAALSHRLHSSKLYLRGLAAAAGGGCKEVSSRSGVTVEFTHEHVPASCVGGLPNLDTLPERADSSPTRFAPGENWLP